MCVWVWVAAEGCQSPHSTYPGSALQEGDLGHGVSLLHQYNMQLVHLSVWECEWGVCACVCVCVCVMCDCVYMIMEMTLAPCTPLLVSLIATRTPPADRKVRILTLYSAR